MTSSFDSHMCLANSQNRTQLNILQTQIGVSVLETTSLPAVPSNTSLIIQAEKDELP